MYQDDVPDLVRLFLLQNIASVTQLEILLLLHAEPDRDWSADDVSRRLANNEASVAGQLEEFRLRGLILSSAGPGRRYRFPASDPAREDDLRALAECYRLKRARVIEIIFSRRA